MSLWRDKCQRQLCMKTRMLWTLMGLCKEIIYKADSSAKSCIDIAISIPLFVLPPTLLLVCFKVLVFISIGTCWEGRDSGRICEFHVRWKVIRNVISQRHYFVACCLSFFVGTVFGLHSISICFHSERYFTDLNLLDAQPFKKTEKELRLTLSFPLVFFSFLVFRLIFLFQYLVY